MKNFVLSFALLGLTACSSLQSHLDSLSSHTAEKREFQVHTMWVQRGTEKDNLAFRKINRMTPILAGSYIIQGNSIDGVVAYDRDTGDKLWRLPIMNGVEASAAIIKNRLFLAALDGNFYSIDVTTGQIIWTFATHSENLGEPLLDNGIVYFQSGNNILYALDAATGKQLWLFSRQDTSVFSIRGASRPALKNGKLFVGFSDGSLVALNAQNGNQLWEVTLNKNKKFRDIDASPVIDGDFIYVPSYDDKLYCISLDKGEVVWRIEGGGYSSVTIVGDKIIYPTSNGELWALNKNNGDVLWKYKTINGIVTQVKPYKGMLVFGESQGKLIFADTNSGKVIGGMEPGRGILSSPLVDEKKNAVYFISGEANVYAIEAKWDRPLWYNLGQHLESL